MFAVVQTPMKLNHTVVVCCWEEEGERTRLLVDDRSSAKRSWNVSVSSIAGDNRLLTSFESSRAFTDASSMLTVCTIISSLKRTVFLFNEGGESLFFTWEGTTFLLLVDFVDAIMGLPVLLALPGTMDISHLLNFPLHVVVASGDKTIEFSSSSVDQNEPPFPALGVRGGLLRLRRRGRGGSDDIFTLSLVEWRDAFENLVLYFDEQTEQGQNIKQMQRGIKQEQSQRW